MFAQLSHVSLRLLFFRAGPQDLPYDPRLTAPLALLAALANGLMLVQLLPMGMAVLIAIAMVAGMGAVTRAILRSRQLEARFHQTYAALLLTTAILTFALVPLFAQLAPMLRAVSTDPSLLEHPDQLKLPQGVAFMMNVLNLWNFAVTAAIYRHAANVSIGIGLVLALLAAVVLLLFVAMVSMFAGALFGVAG